MLEVELMPGMLAALGKSMIRTLPQAFTLNNHPIYRLQVSGLLFLVLTAKRGGWRNRGGCCENILNFLVKIMASVGYM